tara:strand:+ start:1790 stop:2263 length:474 start_codon:yes stop_codon:yes gene_type:complete
MLAMASYFDIFNKRLVDDRIYQISTVLGLGLLLYDNPWGWIPVIAVISITTIIGLGFFVIGAWGGADAKLLIAISVIQPFWSSPFPFEKLLIHPVVSMATFANALILAMIVCIPFAIKQRSLNVTIPFVPFFLVGYVFLILKGDLMSWIVIYGNMFL